MEYAAEQPKDEDAQVALRLQIRRLLTEDAELAAQLRSILTSAEQPQSSVNVTVGGARAVGIGTSRSPLSLGAELGPNDDRRVEMVPARVRAGTDYTVRLRAFNSYENVQLRIYRYVPSCPNREC